MFLRQIVRTLCDSGYSEQEIANSLCVDYGVECSQSTINRIKSGRISRPNWELGHALMQMHSAQTRDSSPPAGAASSGPLLRGELTQRPTR